MISGSQTNPHPGSMAFLAGGGVMGRLTRAFDWSKNTLGPAEDWPQSLKTAVSIMLGCKYPSLICWGKELIHFYNDAYIPVLGKRHPSALGRPGPEVWSEAWPTVGPQADAVMNEGRSHWNEELLTVMTRNGYPEEVYMTFSYGPILDDAGKVGGVFCACTEETQRVLGRRRLRTLRELADRSSRAKSAEEACEIASAELRKNPHDLPFSMIYLLDDGGKRVSLAGLSGLARGTEASLSEIELEQSVASWPFQQVLETGKGADVPGLMERFGLMPGGPWPEPSQYAVALPVMKPGQNQPAGFFIAGTSPRLALDDGYRGFLDLVAGQIATAIANARAYEEERSRAEDPAEIDRPARVGARLESAQLRKTLEEALKESEARYRSLFAHMLDGFAYCQMLFDEHGHPDDFIYLAVNDAFGRMTGLKDVIGKRVTQVFPRIKELNPELFEIYGRVASTGAAERFEVDFRPLGLYLSVSVYSPAKGFFVAVFDNITERKRAEEEAKRANEALAGWNQKISDERRRIFDILETLPVMVCLMTPDYHIPFANRAFREKFGESNGRHCYEYCCGFPQPCANCESFVPLKTGQPHHWEFRLPDGKTVIDVYDFPFADIDGSPLILEMDIDITERKRAEEELRASEQRYKVLSNELELRIRGRTAQLAQRNKDMQDFLFISSHDLLEPLRKIQTFASMVPWKEERLGAGESSYIARMIGAVKDMQERIYSLQAFSHAIASAQIPKKTSLTEALRRALSVLEPEILRTGASIEIKDLPLVEAIDTQLVQLFRHLIGNALKFRREEEPPRVRIYSELLKIESGRSEYAIHVEDNGIGFDEEYLDKIFRPFQRLNDREKYKGAGMGLTICKKILERHNGTITARSKPGKGSTFIITLSAQGEAR